MSYISDSKIFVFPSVQRTNKPESRNLSESNLTTMFRSLVSSDSTFVINEGNVDSATVFEFLIKGYYFKITDSSIGSLFSSLYGTLPSSGSINLYATITVTSTSGFDEIVGADSDNKYQGVVFESSPTTGTGKHSLLLATGSVSVVGGQSVASWSVPKSSNRRYNGSSVYGVIDGNSPEAVSAS